MPAWTVTIWSAGMAALRSAAGSKRNAMLRTSPSAVRLPTQQNPEPHLWCSLWMGVPVVSSGQQSIDMSADASICIVEVLSDAVIAKPVADAPSGASAKEAAIANARIVRTNRIVVTCSPSLP